MTTSSCILTSKFRQKIAQRVLHSHVFPHPDEGMAFSELAQNRLSLHQGSLREHIYNDQARAYMPAAAIGGPL